MLSWRASHCCFGEKGVDAQLALRRRPAKASVTALSFMMAEISENKLRSVEMALRLFTTVGRVSQRGIYHGTRLGRTLTADGHRRDGIDLVMDATLPRTTNRVDMGVMRYLFLARYLTALYRSINLIWGSIVWPMRGSSCVM